MFKDRLQQKFDDFYNSEDIFEAKEISNEILTLLNEKGLIVFEKIAGYDSLYIQTFDKYFSNFDLKPNPFFAELDFVRFGLVMQFQHDQ